MAAPCEGGRPKDSRRPPDTPSPRDASAPRSLDSAFAFPLAISSHGDAANALGPRCERRPFTLDAVIAQPFAIDRFQDVLFVVDSFVQLFEAVDDARSRLGRG